MRRYWIQLFTGLALSLTGLPALTADGDVTEHYFENGLRLVIKEDHRSAIAAHMVWYKAGSIDEKTGTTGVAHVLEHMMFKGTENLDTGEFSATVAALGGRDNAFTSRDYTAYFQVLQAKHLKTVMELEAERMANLKLSEEEFKKEIQVVMEERRWRTEDKPVSQLYEAFFATAFQAHPTRNPVIGWMSDLENMNYLDAQAWYRDWYTPQNAIVVVVGDVDPKQVIEWAKTTYAKVPAKFLSSRKPQDEPKQLGTRRVEVKAPAENPYVVLGFKVPKLNEVENDIDPYALKALSGILDGYSGARLGRDLVQGRRIATQAGAGYDSTGRGPSLFYLDATPAPGYSVQELEQALLEQIERVAKEGVSEAELRRVKAQVIAGQVYKRDSLYGQAMEIGQYLTLGFDVADIDRMIEKFKTVTPEQVQAVAQRYFDSSQMTVGTLDPLPLDQAKPRKRPAGLLH